MAGYTDHMTIKLNDKAVRNTDFTSAVTVFLGLHLLGTANVVTFTNATNLVDETSTPVANGDNLVFSLGSGGVMPTGLTIQTEYFVINKNTNDFQVSLTKGGAAVTFSDDGTATVNRHVGLDSLAAGQAEAADANYARQSIAWTGAVARKIESSATLTFGGGSGFAAAPGIVAWGVIYSHLTNSAATDKVAYGLLSVSKDLEANDKYEVPGADVDVILNTNPVSV